MPKVLTNFPGAFDSPDHLYPIGTINDNNSDKNYINDIKKYFFLKKINVLDLGCAGGQLVRDHLEIGDIAIGLEGSSNALEGAGKKNWLDLKEKNLFLCDITEEYKIYDDNGELILFDIIQMWEVLEHIPKEKFTNLFQNIKNHLKEDGIFVGSVAMVPDFKRHVSIFKKEEWVEFFKQNGFCLLDYPFVNLPRTVHPWPDGFVFLAKKIK